MLLFSTTEPVILEKMPSEFDKHEEFQDPTGRLVLRKQQQVDIEPWSQAGKEVPHL
jgi:hypothetical protein